MNATSITAILVVKGAEYQAVCRGLENLESAPPVVPIPMGIAAVKAFPWQRQAFFQRGATVLVMGLCGSLRPQYRVGDVVLYQSCYTAGQRTVDCDPRFTDWIASQFSASVPRVQALTSARYVNTAAEKQALATTHGTDIVDMEGTAILAALAPLKARVAMLRVVSDGCEWDMPNLTKAIRVNGQLNPAQLLLEMVQQPRASVRFVQGSLQGLRRLRQVTAELFSESKAH